MGKYTEQFDRLLKTSDPEHYERPQYESFMTTPEWRNVEISEHLSQFLREGHSIFRFSYLTQIREIWSVLYQSYAAARKYNSAWEILFSDYMLMDLFVAAFTTGELLPKAFVSFFLYPFLPTTNDTQMQQHLADYFAFYAEDIEIKPFFDHDFKSARAKLKAQYNACTDRTWVDWFTWKVVATDLFFKQYLSYAMHYWFHQEQNIAPSTTDILVKFNIEGHVDEETAKNQFRTALGRAVETFEAELDTKGIAHTDEDDIHIVDDNVFVKKNPSKQGYTSVYARVTAPRFMDFRMAVANLAHENIHIRKIAGQDHVQVKCHIDAPDESKLNQACEKIKQTEDANMLYTYSDGLHNNRRYCLFDVPVKNMHQTLNHLETPIEETGTTPEIKFIHNF